MFTQAYLSIILLSLVHASPIKRANNQLIVSARNEQCLSPAGGAAAVSAGQVGDGTPLITMSCADAAGWDISRGSGSVLLTGTAYALDAGTTPGNNGQLKTWTSYPGSVPQTWYYTDDGRIALTGGDQCIDEGENGPQTYACTTGNTNQAWSIRNKAGGGGDDPAPPPEGVLPNVPRGDVFTDPAGGGRRIHPYNRDDLCLSTQGGEAAVGTPVQVTYCYPNDNPYTQYQLWETSTLTSVIRLASNTALCMDAGDNPSNNGGVKVWSCGDFPQQQWTQMQNQGTVQTSNNQCLDIQVDGLPSEQPNYPNQGVLQTYQCYPGSQQQNFHLLNFE